jgi:hypothetical protein
MSSLAMHTKMTSAQEKQIKDLKKEKWGNILFTLAELQVKSEGPFEDLTDAVQMLVAEIDEKIAANDESYNERSLQHQSEVTRLSGLISTTEVQISNAQNILNNILYPNRAQLQEKLENFHANVLENNAYIEKITFERQEANEAYLARVAEHNDALAAIDECLSILSNVGGPLSLIQVKKVQNSITKVTKTLKRGVENTMIKALVALATNE